MSFKELSEHENHCGEREKYKCEICDGEIMSGFEDNHACLRGLGPLETPFSMF